MPTSFDERQRPERMQRKDGQVPNAVGDDELLYRRCPPEYVKGSVVLEAAVKEHNLSVLRSRYAEPDDARWDSRIYAQTRGRDAFVYPEFFVIEIAVSAVPRRRAQILRAQPPISLR